MQRVRKSGASYIPIVRLLASRTTLHGPKYVLRTFFVPQGTLFLITREVRVIDDFGSSGFSQY